MNETRQYEETIDLLALMVKALRKWPVLLVAMLIGAVVLGGYKGLVPVDHTGEIKAVETQIEAIETKIKPTQTEMDKNLEARRTNERTIETRKWSIESNKKTIVKDKEMIPVQKGELAHWEELLASLESSLKESQDLLTDPSLTAEQHAEIVVQLNSLTGNILNVSAKGSTAKQQISNMETEIENLENDIETFEEDIKDLLEKNRKLQEQIDEQEEEIGKREAEIEELEAQIPDLLVTRASLKTVLKYAILGAALGAFIFCGVIFLQFILDHRLRTSGELKERYNFPILGEFSSEASKKHGKFGQWLDQLSGDVQTHPEEQQVYELVAAGVQTSVTTQPMQLAVTGTVSKEILGQVGEQLKSLLPDTYEIKVETNPVYNAAFLADLKQYTVLLVEAKGFSDKREIERLVDVLYRNEVKVIGVVVK